MGMHQCFIWQAGRHNNSKKAMKKISPSVSFSFFHFFFHLHSHHFYFLPPHRAINSMRSFFLGCSISSHFSVCSFFYFATLLSQQYVIATLSSLSLSIFFTIFLFLFFFFLFWIQCHPSYHKENTFSSLFFSCSCNIHLLVM